MTAVTEVDQYNWNFGDVLDFYPELLQGLALTVLVAVAAMTIAFVLAPLVALGRIYGGRVVGGFLWVYVEIFRLTPLLVQLVWFLYVIPVTLGLRWNVFWLGVIPLSLNVTAYLSEVWRGGITGVASGQREAALATGMTEPMALRRVVMPVALRQNIPIIATMWISLFKDSALVSVVGIHELFYQGRDIANTTFRPLEVFTVVAAIYCILTFPQSLLVSRIDDRFKTRD